MNREERHKQLIGLAWATVREEGSDRLTLGRLAEKAGVTKPVVYDHFRTREGLLAALHREFDDIQTSAIERAIEVAGKTLDATAKVIAESYVDCVLAQGREIPGVIAALSGSPELEQVKRESEARFLEKCRIALAPFARAGDISKVGLKATLGAAAALSDAAVRGEITAPQAKDELFQIVRALVERQVKAE
jgi:AcrR family transcriptional regulator